MHVVRIRFAKASTKKFGDAERNCLNRGRGAGDTSLDLLILNDDSLTG